MFQQEAATIAPPPDSLVLRRPTPADASEVWQLVREAEHLDENSCYAYLLLTTHFADTCVIAELEGKFVGFVTAYLPPTRPGVLFVWQIAVAKAARRMGLGKQMLRHLIARPGAQAARFLEATVSPSNRASRRLFESFATQAEASVTELRGFQAAQFRHDHEEERLLRIGPLEEKDADYPTAGVSGS